MRNLIIEALHKIAQTQDIVVPQDYSKEFNQTGSGKAIMGKPNILKASDADLRKIKERINEAIEIAKAYRNAYVNGNQDENGNIPFKVIYQNRVYDAKIPKAFLSNITAGGNQTDYMYYFNSPEIGDGAVQVKYDKRGYAEVVNVKAKPDMPYQQNLSAAADAGYSKEYDGKFKFFSVKVGVNGKYQEDAKFYSVFASPAIDARIKADIAFRTEIIDFMQGGGDYTSDEKGQELSNKMSFDKKIEKIRKDVETQIGKPITSNQIWMNWKSELLQNNDTPEKQMNLDTTKATNDFINLYLTNGGKKKSEIGMSSTEKDEWEQQQKEKLARIAAAKARLKR